MLYAAISKGVPVLGGAVKIGNSNSFARKNVVKIQNDTYKCWAGIYGSSAAMVEKPRQPETFWSKRGTVPVSLNASRGVWRFYGGRMLKNRTFFFCV